MILTLLAAIAFADSPITSTNLWESYKNHPMVSAARESGELDEDTAKFLSRGKRGLDLKAAVINALGWHFEGKTNATLYLAFLGEKYEQEPEYVQLHPDELRPQEAFSLGYLLALDNYFDAEPALAPLAVAREKLPRSKTVALVEALVGAQLAMEEDWCLVFTIVDAVLKEPKLRPDLKFSAEQQIGEYVGLYESSCPEPEVDGSEEQTAGDEEARVENRAKRPLRK